MLQAKAANAAAEEAHQLALAARRALAGAPAKRLALQSSPKKTRAEQAISQQPQMQRAGSSGGSSCPISVHSSGSESESKARVATAAVRRSIATAAARRAAVPGPPAPAPPSVEAPQPASSANQVLSWSARQPSREYAGSWLGVDGVARSEPESLTTSASCVNLVLFDSDSQQSDRDSRQSSPMRALQPPPPGGEVVFLTRAVQRFRAPEPAEAMALTPAAAAPSPACSMQLGTPLRQHLEDAHAAPSPACGMQLGTPPQPLRAAPKAAPLAEVISLMTP